ncbi:MAG: glycosyl hydrolase family 28 protein [Christiangramia sp.]|uniref:glycosyl hydrolase family 28 protein n=1 Tax=Christiangramia sp. TaxID=1931228 RepID=UPI003241F12E
MKKILYILLASLLAGFSQHGIAQKLAPVDAALYQNLEFDMPKVEVPQFPDFTVNLPDVGGKADGIFDNSEAFSKAINKVTEAGGGKVEVPRGIWFTGPIELKSNVNLHLQEEALVIFSANFDDYELVETSFEGLNTLRNQSPISALNAENIAITGKGVIDGSGDAWRPVKKGKMAPANWKKLVKSGGVLSEDGEMWFPSESSLKGYTSSSNFNVPDLIDSEELQSVKDFLRPVMVSIRNCKNVLLDGPTFQNSPAWNLHPVMSENIVIRNLTVRNPWYSQNGDGLDLESCRNVLIYNNSFDVGDDAICLKSGKNEAGRERAMPTENVVISNNTVYHAHGGFVVGSEMSGGVNNIHVSNCTFIGTDSGVRFKSTRGRGGLVENIFISNIDMIDIGSEAVRFNMFYNGNSPVLDPDEDAKNEERDEKLEEVSEKTPIFRNIFLKNITSTGSKKAGIMVGLPEMKLENAELENAVFEAEEGFTLIDAQKVRLKNVKILLENGPSLVIYNSSDISVEKLEINETNASEAIQVLGKINNIDLSKSGVSEEQIRYGKKISSTEKSRSKLIEVTNSEELIAALDEPKPGDSIVLRPGNYQIEQRLYINDSGDKDRKIYLFADSVSERPLLDFSALTEDSSHQGIVLKADNWHIRGLRVFKAGDNGMQVRGNNNVIEFCSFSECADTGLQLDDGASNNTILNCDSYFNADSKLENADGFAVKMDVGSGNRFIGCRSWNNLDDGWDGYLREADNIQTTYENCWAFNNGFLKNGKKSRGDGNGFKTGGSDLKKRSHNATFFQCIAVNNASDGFDHNSNRGEISILNCSATGNGRNFAFAEKNSLRKITILNSLVLGELGKYNAETEKVENNSWQLDFSISENDFDSMESAELSAPRQKDGSLPEISFFRPKLNSKAATAGRPLDNSASGCCTYLGALKPIEN